MNSANEILKTDIVQSNQTKGNEVDLREYWRLVNQSKWSIAGLTLVVCTLVLVMVYSMTPVFQSTATLLIESEQANVVSIEEVYGIDSSQREYYQTQFEILNSRKLAQRVIQELGLRAHPEYNPDLLGKVSIRNYIPFLPPPEALSEEQKSQTLMKQFTDNLTISPIRSTQLVNVSFESEDPELAPRVANALGNAYINSHLEARLELTQRASSWLTEQLSGMRDELAISEHVLNEFKETENLVDVSGVKTLTAKELDEQTRRLVEARKLTAAAKSQHEAVGNRRAGFNLRWETLPGVINDHLAQKLKEEEAAAENAFNDVQKRYGPKHPKYISAASKLQSSLRAYRNRVSRIVDGFDEQYQQALADLQVLERALETSKRDIQDINRKTYELSQLEREVTTNRQLYDMFFQRFQETNKTDFAAANARFVDTATRSYIPTKPRKGLMVGLAGVMSIVVGVLLAFLRSAMDNTIRVAEQLEEKLGQGVLGVLPFEKKPPKDAKMALLYLENGHNAFAEAVRSLRTSIVLSGLDKPHKVTIVTSSVPSEGKTTVSSNIALALGQMEKVLLVDADMRRPSLATEYGFEKGTLGLAELVAGTSDIQECIHPCQSLGIDLLPAGAVPPNPLDLLSSSRFDEILADLCSKYDRIIIDSAPTQAVSDSMVLSTKADALIYVVKSDSTPANVALNGIERLKRVNAPIVGAVLNQFDADAASKYGYYGSGRYGYYGYGYASKSYN
jgi:polysaccharide biosynthesis transport protein